jgi:hypothetical protein
MRARGDTQWHVGQAFADCDRFDVSRRRAVGFEIVN